MINWKNLSDNTKSKVILPSINTWTITGDGHTILRLFESGNFRLVPTMLKLLGCTIERHFLVDFSMRYAERKRFDISKKH